MKAQSGLDLVHDGIQNLCAAQPHGMLYAFPLLRCDVRLSETVKIAGVRPGLLLVNDAGLTERREYLREILVHEAAHLLLDHSRLVTEGTKGHPGLVKAFKLAAECAANSLVFETCGRTWPGAVTADKHGLPLGQEFWYYADYFSKNTDPSDDDDKGDVSDGTPDPNTDTDPDADDAQDAPFDGGGDIMPPDPTAGSGEEQELAGLTLLMQSAAAAEMAGGSSPGWASAAIADALDPPNTAWISKLRRMFQPCGKTFTWHRPSRRCMQTPAIMPGTKRTNGLRSIAILLDVSGSIPTATLAVVIAHVKELRRIYPRARVVVVQWDTAVRDVVDLGAYEAVPAIDRKGSGGTLLQPALDAIADRKEFGLLAGAVIVTDGELCDTPTKPAYPVLWLFTNARAEAPFGDSAVLPQ